MWAADLDDLALIARFARMLSVCEDFELPGQESSKAEVGQVFFLLAWMRSMRSTDLVTPRHKLASFVLKLDVLSCR